MSEAVPILSTHGLVAGYGDFQALFGVDFEIAPGEIVALIGANGAGKSTFLRAIMGLLPSRRDMIRFDGAPIGGAPTHSMVGRGITMVPEGRRLFTGMTVEDNLRVAMDCARSSARRSESAPWTIERLHELFPILADKRGTPVERLSGGQQQMVAIARALLGQPRLLLCDELSLGLAPAVIRDIYRSLPLISATGTAMILVEQDVGLAKTTSHRLYCMLEGRMTLTGRSENLDQAAITDAYFGSHHAVA
ncbi:ABC transporter ATP-binding protein [Bradyrhizobium tropiciagri]|uniref:ABC transporter ATP-binding protein n=1 Tax=Bradyrhizobium tropiciagri TaxID=312253 RepID=UPI001BA4E537|nr:ABC transporter ATP-binding protein [Bradyrhizobium tropiciagri]MBR0899183.1 ABC transporter ATP-binding protein [Bradyrhizobium tropiciagri]